MGGTGSGRWGHHTARLTIDQCDDMSRVGWWSGVLEAAYCAGEWRITKDEKSIHAWRDGEQVQLDLPNGTSRAVWAPQPRGGRRWWWQCGTCAGRVGVLYRRGQSSWRCRRCWNLSYTSSNESDSHPRVFWERMVRGDVSITIYNFECGLRAVAWAEWRYAQHLARAARDGARKPTRRRRRKRSA